MVSTRKKKKDLESQPDCPAPKEEDAREPIDQDTEDKSEHRPKRHKSSAIDTIQSHARAKWLLIGSGSTMAWDVDRERTELSFTHLTIDVENWVMGYAASEPADLDRLSEEQKVAIISSLEGLCVQEGWDALLGQVPGIGLGNGLVVELFLMAMVFQDLHRRVIERPFWYLDGKSHRDQDGDGTFGERLEYLYGKFLETNPIMAGYWIRETVRLSNSVNPFQAPDSTYGRYNQDRREAAATRLADDFLAGRPVQSLLKIPDDDEFEKRRRKDLVGIYKRAGHAAVLNDSCSGQAKFLGLADLGPTYADSDRLSAHAYHCLEDDRLDGHRIFLVIRPAILRKFTVSSTSEFETVLPAIVMMEDERINASD